MYFRLGFWLVDWFFSSLGVAVGAGEEGVVSLFLGVDDLFSDLTSLKGFFWGKSLISCFIFSVSIFSGSCFRSSSIFWIFKFIGVSEVLF